MLGIVVDLVMMLLFSRPLIILLGESVIPKIPAFWGVPKGGQQRAAASRRDVAPMHKPNFDFMGNRKNMFIFSAVLITFDSEHSLYGICSSGRVLGRTVIKRFAVGNRTQPKMVEAFSRRASSM
jgi:hypothetical protein